MPNVTLLCSTQSPWSGFFLERQGVVAEGRNGAGCVLSHSIVVVLAGSIDIEQHTRHGQHRFVAGPGSITVWAKGHEFRSIFWGPSTQPCEALRIDLDASTLTRLAPGDDPLARFELLPQWGVENPALATLMRLMGADVAAGCPTGRLYGESLSLAFAAHLAGRYSTGPVEIRPKGGLSRLDLRRVLEYVRAHLDRNASLAELSSLLGLSPYYFSRAFKTSVGMSPHQYIITQRIAEGRRLLATGRMSLAEVAHAVGFAHQSHFADAFRKATGTTPGRYRLER